MAQGKQFSAAIRVSSTWGTATTAASGDKIPLLTSGAGGGAEEVPDSTASGNLWGDPSRAGNKRYAFPITCEGKYRGLEALIAVALGASGGTSTTVEAGANEHKFTPTSSTMRMGTYVEDKDVAVWEFDSFKVKSLTISGSRGGPVEVGAEIVCRNLLYGTGVNDTTTFASATLPSGALMFFSQGRFRMNTQGGATLATNIGIDAFSVTVTPGVDEDAFRADGVNSLVIAEPGRQANPTVTGSFSLDEYSANTYRALRDGLTPQKMEMLFTGTTLIGSTQYPLLRIQCPYIQIVNDDPTLTGPERVPESIEFKAFPVSTAPTGMTITTAIEVKVLSTLTTDPLTGNTA